MNKQNIDNKISELAIKYESYGNLMVYKNKELIINKSFGYANKEKEILITAETLVSFLSNSLLLMNLVILKLSEEKLLSLDDSVDKYISNYNQAYKLKVFDLLTSKTGLKDYHNELTKVEQETTFYKSLSVVEQQQYDFEIASRYVSDDEYLDFLNKHEINDKYKNYYLKVNYFLAKLVIEKVTKTTLFDYLQKEIFSPLGITIYDSFNYDLLSYDRFSGGVILPIKRSQKIEKCFSIKISDLGTFYQAVFNYKIISKKSFSKLLPKGDEYWGIAASYEYGFCRLGFDYQGAYSAGLYSFSSDTLIVLTRNLTGKTEYGPINDKYFYSEVIDLIKQNCFAYNKPKLKPLSKKYIKDALKIDVREDQYSNVGSGALTIAWCSVEKNSHIYILIDNDIVVGLCVLIWNKKENEYSIEDVKIDQKYQNRGYGKVLISEGLKILQRKGATKISIGVNKNNIYAFKIYIGAGFKIKVSNASGYYELEWIKE
ncbi:MAG: GNAT family N-acetyltransferase [Bacillales bacterium]|jgi:CubicO group peptidase (beta-lactamase class C family)/ribosomal protein S18 acetylase RimI-like enzyme|nr:GNAT family N-acetyltransferase [Bacillales bacterium]